MLLSYYTATTNMTRKTQAVDDCYQSLGLLSQIAKNVRDYKISQFGGATKSRTAILHDAQTPTVIKTTTFVRQWIKDTEERGLLDYKRKNIIPTKWNALQDATRRMNVTPISLDWESFGALQVSTHLTALATNSKKLQKTSI